MRIELTKQACRWLADLANKAKIEADFANKETPHALFELRRANMSDLEDKINKAIQRQTQREARNRAR